MLQPFLPFLDVSRSFTGRMRDKRGQALRALDGIVGVGRVERLGDPLREGAVGHAGETACARDGLSGGIHSHGGAGKRDRFRPSRG